jgi:CHAT domain-containing protein
MPEPRFNKALCLEMLGAPDPAKSAWQEYLEIDSNSKWADEARRHLERLEQNPIKELSADELESSFLDAMRAGNDDEAAKLLSSNRELIREKYLPQRLAMSYVEAMDDRRDELLQALQYAGKLEIKQAGDPFASEIARFYLAATPVQLEELKQAQADTRTGYANCLSSDYDEALASFEASQKLFDASGDKWEANLARYFVGYALMNNDRSEVAIHEFKSTVEFAHMDGYLWLETTALYWTGATYQKLKQHNLARRSFERALSIAEKINDPYAVHRNLIELARLSALCGRRSMALEYVFQLVQQSNNKQGSLRQRYRDINLVLHALSSERLFDAANAIALEQVAVAESLKDPTWLVEAPTDAGVTFAQVSDFTNARDWLNRGLAATDSIANEKTRIRWKAYSYSKLGDLERSQGNSTEAERLFSKAVEIYNSLDMPAFLAQAQEGLLITDIELGKTDEAEIQIANGIRTVEEYRRSILDEQERAGFLDASQNIYDIAADFEFRRANYESAYDYAEISSSRSLLDWLEKGAIVNRKAHSLAIAVAGDVQPKHLAEIRAGLKTGECVLQYTVLDKKVLIWFVSAEKFSVHEVLIGSDELNDLVSSYTQAILTKDGSTSGGGPEAGRKLYELLVAPVVGEIAGANEVCIVPNKALFELPFAALTSPGGKPLLADIDIVYAPSANVFLHCSKSAEEKAGFENEKVLAVGNPQFESSAFDDLPSLVGAEDEVKNVAAFYPERETLTRQYATKRSFLNALTKANVVQFSGHYIVVPDAPMLSYLLLAKDSDKAEDSMLTNLELAEHKLPRAKLIVLAACRTGSESVSNGEGLIGLSRTFLAADVPLVVASQWSVDTDATAVLMKRFHELRTRERLNTTEALRRAQLEMLNDPSGRFNEPYYWAAFAVYGGHADF